MFVGKHRELNTDYFIDVFRQLHCERVTLHKHLFTSYVLNGLAWILYYTQAALNAAVLADNPVNYVT